MLSALIEGEEGILRSLGVLADGLLDLTLPMHQALQIGADSVLTSIVAGGRPPYPDILPQSRARRKYDTGTPPLWDSGALIAAMTATQPGVEGSIFEMAPNGYFGQVGPDPLFEGARRHFLGDESHNEPSRPAMDLQIEDEAAMMAPFEMYFGALLSAVAK